MTHHVPHSVRRVYALVTELFISGKSLSYRRADSAASQSTDSQS